MIVGEYIVSRPLPSSKNPHFQNKRGQVHNLSCENKIFFARVKNHSYIKG